MKTNAWVLVLLLLSGCSTLAWIDQPYGARDKLVRCLPDLGEAQCGSRNLKDPQVQSCLQPYVTEYRACYDKEGYLKAKGCHNVTTD